MSRHVRRVGHYLIEAGILDEDNNRYDSLIPTKFRSEWIYASEEVSFRDIICCERLCIIYTPRSKLEPFFKKLCLSCIEGCSWIYHKAQYRLDHAINTRKEQTICFHGKLFLSSSTSTSTLSLSNLPLITLETNITRYMFLFRRLKRTTTFSNPLYLPTCTINKGIISAWLLN